VETNSSPGLQIARDRRLYHFVDEGLTETKRIFREQGVFHICTEILVFRYRQKYTLGLHTDVITQREAAAASTHYCWFAA